ncbi:Hypothetical predicted protein [Mytilus galloprovincialis]|uniref:SSD domain-containing protein n=1 Tax=Mytilus galloprovincialis TaxID=29158 RepID=A0A8B6HKC7_MYTGA|nr:Hypothetical predicted protein [Mytilus galloprovincialis]
MKEEGKSKARIMCCGGEPRTKREEVEGPIEKYPKRVLKQIVSNTPSKVIIIVLFLAYLGVASWGASNFRDELDLRNLVSKDSYHYKFYDTNIRLFSQSFFVSFVIRSETNYSHASSVFDISSLLKKARDDKDIVDTFQLSWLDSYMQSSDFNITTHSAFILGLKTFLNTNSGNMFVDDVTIEGSSIVASRFHVLSNSLTESSNQASLMIRLRDLTKSSSLSVFVFSPNFIFFEQYVQIVPQTIQTLAIAVSVVFLVTAAFMPLPVLILLVTISVSMIMVGVIGLMEIWGLTLSSVTMIHIVMCIGFSVDFSAHICHAYAHCPGNDRHVRVKTAIDMAGGPILNGALSSLIGIVVLAFSQSYIFFSFFKVMSIVVVVGAMHAIFLLPVLLCLIGPIYRVPVTKPKHNNEMEPTDHKTPDDRKQSNKESNDTEHDKYKDLMSYKINTIPRLSTANIRDLT